VTGLDASPTLLRAAAERDPGGTYVAGSAEALPFADQSFGLVVAYNVLMDVADMPAAVAEAARVLAPGGHLCACVTHPLADAGDWAHDDARKSVGVAGGRVLADAKLSIPNSLTRFATAHPVDDEEVAAGLTAVIDALLGQTTAPAA